MGWCFKYVETLEISTLDPTHWSAKRLILTPKSCCSKQFMNKGNILFSYVILNYVVYSVFVITLTWLTVYYIYIIYIVSLETPKLSNKFSYAKFPTSKDI